MLVGRGRVQRREPEKVFIENQSRVVGADSCERGVFDLSESCRGSFGSTFVFDSERLDDWVDAANVACQERLQAGFVPGGRHSADTERLAAALFSIDAHSW